jgi:hypothetical protein
MHTYSKKRVIASQQRRITGGSVLGAAVQQDFVKGAQKKARMNTYA